MSKWADFPNKGVDDVENTESCIFQDSEFTGLEDLFSILELVNMVILSVEAEISPLRKGIFEAG